MTVPRRWHKVNRSRAVSHGAFHPHPGFARIAPAAHRSRAGVKILHNGSNRIVATEPSIKTLCLLSHSCLLCDVNAYGYNDVARERFAATGLSAFSDQHRNEQYDGGATTSQRSFHTRSRRHLHRQTRTVRTWRSTLQLLGDCADDWSHPLFSSGLTDILILA